MFNDGSDSISMPMPFEDKTKEYRPSISIAPNS